MIKKECLGKCIKEDLLYISIKEEMPTFKEKYNPKKFQKPNFTRIKQQAPRKLKSIMGFYARTAQKKLRDTYGIKTVGKTKNQQQVILMNASQEYTGVAANSVKQAYRNLAHVYNEAVEPVRVGVIRDNAPILFSITLRFRGWNWVVEADTLQGYWKLKHTKDKIFTSEIISSSQKRDFISWAKKKYMKENEDSPFDKNIVDIIQQQTTPQVDKIPLVWILIKSAGVLNLDGTLANSVWCKDRNMCVVDFIQYRYKNSFKKNMTDERIEYWATHIKEDELDKTIYNKTSCYEDDVLKKAGMMNPNKTGYTLTHIRNWAEAFSVNVYCLIDSEISWFYLSDLARQKHTKPLVFELKNNHMYAITDTKKIKSITNKPHSSILKEIESSTQMDAREKKEEEKAKVTSVVFKDMELWNSLECQTNLNYAMEVMSKDNLITYPATNLIIFNKGLLSFRLGDKKYLLQEDVKDDSLCTTSNQKNINNELKSIKKYCKDRAITYTGQSPVQFVQPILSNFKKEYCSYFSKDVAVALYNDEVKRRSHYGMTSGDDYKYKLSLDINKCYRSVMEKPRENWMLLDFNNTIEDYVESKTAPLGLYYVETSDMTLFHSSNWYSSAMINYAKNTDIEFKVICCIKATRSAPLNIFIEIIENIQLNFPDTQVQKLMINCIYGILMKTKSSSTIMNIDEDLQRVWDCYYKVQGKKNESLLHQQYTTQSGKVLYAYGYKKKKIIFNTNLPMGIQITDQANIRLYKMIKKMKGEHGTLMYRNTDNAIIGYRDETHIPNVKTNKSVGGYSLKDIPPLFTKSDEFKVPTLPMETPSEFRAYNYYWETIKEDSKWTKLNYKDSNDYFKIQEEFINNRGGMLLGRAGTGKSYVSKKSMEVWDKLDLKYKALAFTNKATIQLKGSTIHKYLCIDKEGKLNHVWARNQGKNIDVIIIDEISMISGDLWKILGEFKYYTGCIFILVGDYRQLPPVKDKYLTGGDDFFNHPTIKYLCNNMRCELTSMKRYDIKLWDLLEEIWEKDKYSSKTNQFLRKTTKIKTIEELINSTNICYDNATRKEICRRVMDYYRDDTSTFMEYAGDPNKYNQDIYLYKGAKFMMNITTKCKTFKKNELVEVVEYDEKTIKLTNGTIELEMDYYNKRKKCIFHDLFLSGYASTIHKCQGDTITGMVNIFNLRLVLDYLCDKRILYTALSRATSIDNILMKRL